MRFLKGDAVCRMTRPDCAVMCNFINIHTYPVLHVVANTVPLCAGILTTNGLWGSYLALQDRNKVFVF